MMSVCTSCCARAGVFVREDVIPEVPCDTPVTFEADEPPYSRMTRRASPRSAARDPLRSVCLGHRVSITYLPCTSSPSRIQGFRAGLFARTLQANFLDSKKPRTSPSFAKERHTSPSSEEGAGSCAAVTVARARFRFTTRSQIEFAWGDEKTNTRFELAPGRLRPPSDCSGSVVETQSVTCVVWPVMSENSTSFATDIIAFSS